MLFCLLAAVGRDDEKQAGRQTGRQRSRQAGVRLIISMSDVAFWAWASFLAGGTGWLTYRGYVYGRRLLHGICRAYVPNYVCVQTCAVLKWML